MTKVLFVVSAADRWTLKDGDAHPSGFWGEEVAVPHRIFAEAGWEITIATPGGKVPTQDPASMSRTAGRPSKLRGVASYLDLIKAELNKPRVLAEMDPDEFDVVFYPGGHGPMEDLSADPGALIARVLASGKPLALLCHAPAAALAARNGDGSWPFAGFRMTGLSNVEEKLTAFGRKAPWLLEDRLREGGAEYAKARLPLRPYVVVDRNLYTGQNPASSEPLARRIVAEQGAPVLEVTVSRLIKARREELHAFVSDLARMGEISPENRSTRWIQPDRRFTGRNAIGPFYRWSMGGTVTEDVPGSSFAFLTDSPSETYWRYTFTTTDHGTLVTEAMRKHTAQIRPVVLLQDVSGARDRRAHLAAGMRTTLERLAARFEGAQ